MKYRIARLAVLRTSVTIAAMYAAIAVVIWLGVIASWLGGPLSGRPDAFLLGLPIWAGGAVFALMATYCALYNVVARWTGGIEFGIEATRERA